MPVVKPGQTTSSGVFGSWLLPCWQSDNSISNGSAGANWTCSVGLLSSTASMLLSACSEGADPGRLTLRACSEGQVVGRRVVRAGPSV